MRNRYPFEQLKFLISTIVPPRRVFRVRVAKTRRAKVLIFGTFGERRTLYSNCTKSSANIDALLR